MRSARTIIVGGLPLLLFGLAGAALAHTTVTAVTPADGSQLDASPPAIEIQFEHEVRLTSVVLLAQGERGRQLAFTPHGSAVRFRVERPDLAPGDNEIEWKALSTDGHVIRGTLTYLIRSTPADAR